MDKSEMKEAFERFFEKYKKTEGDLTTWSAFWEEYLPSGAQARVTLSRCPAGDTFKVFKNGKKLGELNGYDAFFDGMGPLFGEDWDAEAFFGSMRTYT